MKKGDRNYNDRQDKTVDFFEFDSDQNYQIEQVFQECIKGLRKFGEKFTIIGDQNCLSNGWQYEVWGTSDDASTWFERNITLSNAPKRRLRRVLKDAPDLEAMNPALRPFIVVQEERKEPDAHDIFAQVEEDKGDDEEDLDLKEGEVDHRKHIVTICGQRAQVLKLREEVNIHSQNPRNFIASVDLTVPVPPEFVAKLKAECSKRFETIELQLVNDKLIKIIGFNSQQAKRFVIRVLAIRTNQLTKIYVYPPTWSEVDKIEDQLCTIWDINKSSPEYIPIESKFTATFPEAIVVKIQRI